MSDETEEIFLSYDSPGGGRGFHAVFTPDPSLARPIPEGINTFKWWKYHLQNASEMFSKSGNLAIWPFMLLRVSNSQIN